MTWTRLGTLTFAALVAVAALAIPHTAEAGRYWRHGYWGPGPYWGAGLVGLGVGLAVGSALAAPPVYVAPPPPYAYVPPPPPPPVAYGPGPYAPGPYVEEPYAPAAYAGGPGGQDWIAYCSSKYRSFNPATGMYTGYDGRQHPCR